MCGSSNCKECQRQSECRNNISDKEVEQLWDELEDVLFVEAKDYFKSDTDYEDDSSLVLSSDWRWFSAGTAVEEVWSWMNNHHSKGLNYLVSG